MKVLIFGGTGNISGDFVSLLLKDGHEVTLINRGNHFCSAGCRQLIANHSETDKIRRLLDGQMFDLAVDFICFNEKDASDVYSSIHDHCRHFIFISTTVVYSKPPSSLPVSEDAPKGNDFSEYGRGKWAAEKFFIEKYEQEKFPLTIVRPSHTYSRRWIPNPLTSAGYTLAYRLEHRKPVFIHDDGTGLWTLTHTLDFGRNLLALGKLSASIGEDYNLTSNFVYSWNDIMQEICLALNLNSEPEIVHIPSEFICSVLPVMHDKLYGDKKHPGIFDNTKIKRLIRNFDCEISFAKGIRESIRWFREVPRRQIPDPVIDEQYEKLLTAWKSENRK